MLFTAPALPLAVHSTARHDSLETVAPPLKVDVDAGVGCVPHLELSWSVSHSVAWHGLLHSRKATLTTFLTLSLSLDLLLWCSISRIMRYRGCVLQARLLARTHSGEHKFKVGLVLVSISSLSLCRHCPPYTSSQITALIVTSPSDDSAAAVSDVVDFVDSAGTNMVVGVAEDARKRARRRRKRRESASLLPSNGDIQ